MTADIHMPFFSNINLDLVKTQAWVPQQIFATEGDNGYGQIFSLYENGNPYISATVNNLNFRAIKPDNNIVDIKNGQGFKAIDGQSNQFAFQVPAQTFAATGRVECYFYVTNSENTIVASTTHFFYEVQRSVPSETGSVSYIASLQGIVDEANALKKQADDLVAGLTESKTNASTMVNDFQNDLVSKKQDIEKQADQMLADAKTALDKTIGAATDYQTKLDNLNKQYLQKYNELLAKLPEADDEVKRQISNAIAQIKDDEQAEFQQISMDWVNKKQDLDKSIQAYQNTVSKQLDSLKAQISTLSGDNVAQLSKQIDDLQTKLNGMHLADYYTKKEIDDKLDNYQHSIDLSSYETSSHAEQTYAKKSDIVAPDVSGFETKTDAESTYAKKTDIPAPADLSDYAKTADVAKTYETKADAATHITKETADATYAKTTDIPDLSGYAKKSDIPQGQDLSGYETKEYAESTYAKKSDIPVAPDLSSYAKSADIAKTYETKSDASTHLTKEDAQSTYATKDDLANVKPNLDGYAKTTDLASYETKNNAEQTYAKKTDIPAEPDLSQYAKKSDLSPVKSISVLPNGWPADAAGNPVTPDAKGNVKIDLHNYVYESELATTLEDYLTCENGDERYAKKSDIPAAPDLSSYAKSADVAKTYETKEDASTHLTKEDAQSTYATKDDLANVKPNLDGYAKTTDLASYETKTDAEQNYAKKTDIPAEPDLSGYETKTEADATYAKKADIPEAPDLSQYVTTTDANKKYVKNVDLPAKAITSVAATDLYGKTGNSVTGTINFKGDKLVNILIDSANGQGGQVRLYTAGLQSELSKRLTKDDADKLYQPITHHIVTNVALDGINQNYNTSTGTVTLNLNSYLTKRYASDTYAKKSDIPASPDLSSYVTNTVLDNKKFIQDVSFNRGAVGYSATKLTTLYRDDGTTSNNLSIDLPQLANLLKPDFSEYLTTETADSTYAKKTDIPTVPDMSSYLTKTDADNKYIKKAVGSISFKTYVDTTKGYGNQVGITNEGNDLDGVIDTSGMTFPSITTVADSFITDEDSIKDLSSYDSKILIRWKDQLYAFGHKIQFAD